LSSLAHIHGGDSDIELNVAFSRQAVYSRDRRFDGRFFAGIAATGIYCRPVCPVSFGTPDRIVWFSSAAAATAAGFRPCKRCRPDTSPGTPAWFGTAAVVSHAVKLISEGALNDGNVEQLSERLGIGSRHLRRLFKQHLGAPPLKIARSQRVQFAGNLIANSTMPIREIASCAGFASTRHFHHSVKAAFGDSPRVIRRLRATPLSAESRDAVIVYLPYRRPFDWASLIRFLAERAIPGVERVENGSYSRTVEVEGLVGTIHVRDQPDSGRLAMRVRLPRYDCLMQIVQRATRLFDLETDTLQIVRHLSREPSLTEIVITHPGLRVPGSWEGFEIAVRAVLGQQLTVVDSPALVERIVRKFGRAVELPRTGLSHIFPSPAILAVADLRALGIPKQMAEVIGGLARAILAGNIRFDGYGRPERSLALLRSLPGISEAALSYVAMRSLGDPNAVPQGDIGIRRALAGRGKAVSPQQLLRVLKNIQPWRAYAAMQLWSHARRQGYKPRSRDRNEPAIGVECRLKSASRKSP
jgi:AraC family transcriptional regulator, regulatory protein of adaptative response / DNA-3-methyladenine glycosylase II